MKKKLIFALFGTIARLPLWMLYLFADFAAFVLCCLVRYRLKVVRENLRSSFPDKTEKELRKIEKEYYRFLADQIVETLKLLHISDKELIRRVKVVNYEAVNETLERGGNAVLLMGHYCNWEWVQEITRYFVPQAYMVSIYHPLNHKIWDDLFIKIRSRWGSHIVPMKKATRILLNKANTPWVCGFIADAYTWQKHDDNCIDFLNHDTWFITGPEEIGRRMDADFFYLETNKIKRGYYEIRFHRLEPHTEEPYAHLRQFWKEFEATIRRAPAYWLWSHKRWK